jgi:hypothetical protein
MRGPEEAGGAPAGDRLAALRRITRSQPPVERCELCGTALHAEHPHLLERATRRIACACHACTILFCDQEGGRYLRVPRRVRRLADFGFSDLEWEEMMLPIGLAFFLRAADGRTVAMYPSPGGVVESLIALENWDERAGRHPALRTMEPEVEALLVNRIAPDPLYFLVPIDECYRLAGLMRRNWRGLSGGPQVWGAVAKFFEELRQKAGSPQVRYA